MSAIRASAVYIRLTAVCHALNGVCVLWAPKYAEVLNNFCFLFHPDFLFSARVGGYPIHPTSVCT